MCNNLTAEQITWIIIFFWLGTMLIWGHLTEAKAKAFNEGYKRGRSTRLAKDGVR
jgi:hypothetical protein